MPNPKSSKIVAAIATIILLAAGSARSFENDPNQSGLTMEFVRIPAGSFYIEHAHHVQFTKPFYMGKYEVTQAQWKAVMGTTVNQQHKKANSFWHLKGVSPEHPIYYVSWEEAAEFCKRLGSNFRLPAETEWEYACRAGSNTDFYYGNDPNYSKLNLYAWYYDNSKGSTHPVGQKKPNQWGLYDMYGNVSEWCSDRNEVVIYKAHVCRGGNWIKNAKDCNSSTRYSNLNPRDLVGFRVVFNGNIDDDKKVLKITLPKNTVDPNIVLKPKPETKPVTRLAIKGIVRDQKGMPIGGVYLNILPRDWIFRKYPEGRFEAYRFDNSSQTNTQKYHFWARHLQRNLAAFVEFNEDVNMLDIKLQSGAILTGRIVDPHGQGIEDAKITTQLQPLDWKKLLLPTIIKPDVEGKFEIRALPLGHKYRLIARSMGYRLNKIEFSSGNTPNNRIDIGPILLDRGQFSVSGIVLDKKRKPVADAWIYCSGENQVGINSRTNKKGRFTAHGIFKGLVIINASKKDISGVLWYGQKHTHSGATNVKVVLRQKTRY